MGSWAPDLDHSFAHHPLCDQGSSLNFCVPRLPHVKKRDNNIDLTALLCRLNVLIDAKVRRLVGIQPPRCKWLPLFIARNEIKRSGETKEIAKVHS